MSLENIYILIAICSLVLAAISVITVVLTLRQNSKMIESSTRPYVTVYGSKINFGSPFFYFTVKNFGNSSGVITKFECDYDLSKLSLIPEHRPFENLVGSAVVPGQSYKFGTDLRRLASASIEKIGFTIEYERGKKKYSEVISININSHSELTLPRVSTNDSELKHISFSLQSLVEQNL